VILLDARDEKPAQPFGTVDSAQEKAATATLYGAVEERLNTLPDVRSASLSWLGLFGGSDLWLRVANADKPSDRQNARVDYVSSRYFETVGMQILRGRGFNDRDRDGSPRVAVVNEQFARERFGGDEALGRRVILEYKGEEDRPFTIVGVVRNSKYNDLREHKIESMIWTSLAQTALRIKSIALRVEPGAEPAVVRQARAVLTSTAPHIMVRTVTTLSAEVDETTSRERLLLGLASSFGGLALLLAAIGLYGTLAFTVASRTREIGVRLALGAGRGKVLRMVVRDALILAAGGAVIGVPLALLAGNALRTFLFGVTPYDMTTLLTACAVLTIVAALAAYLPARRASRVDPAVALRWE
jgi:predicted permease